MYRVEYKGEVVLETEDPYEALRELLKLNSYVLSIYESDPRKFRLVAYKEDISRRKEPNGILELDESCEGSLREVSYKLAEYVICNFYLLSDFKNNLEGAILISKPTQTTTTSVTLDELENVSTMILRLAKGLEYKYERRGYPLYWYLSKTLKVYIVNSNKEIESEFEDISEALVDICTTLVEEQDRILAKK